MGNTSIKYICSECGKKFALATPLFRCDCGGLFDLEKGSFKFTRKDILSSHGSLFRYLKALPFQEGVDHWQDITLGEGFTPIVPLEKDWSNFLVKVDYMMPTLSFEGIAIARPLRGKQVLEAVRATTGGEIITAPEEEIPATQKYLAAKGFYVEPTTAATFAGFFRYCKERKCDKDVKYLLPLCGAGLKS